jgi:hypothetical protein
MKQFDTVKHRGKMTSLVGQYGREKTIRKVGREINSNEDKD